MITLDPTHYIYCWLWEDVRMVDMGMVDMVDMVDTVDMVDMAGQL